MEGRKALDEFDEAVGLVGGGCQIGLGRGFQGGRLGNDGFWGGGFGRRVLSLRSETVEIANRRGEMGGRGV